MYEIALFKTGIILPRRFFSINIILDHFRIIKIYKLYDQNECQNSKLAIIIFVLNHLTKVLALLFL